MLMEITIHDPQADGLLLCGVPLAAGALASGAGLVLCDDQHQGLPLWWEERAHWPDGTVKWLFLHARLGSQSRHLTLARGAADAGSIELEDNKTLVLGQCRLSLNPRKWHFSSNAARMDIRLCPVQTDPPLDLSGDYTLELVEASPIAPLVRWRQTQHTGLRFDHLLRLDACNHTLHWSQRLSFLHHKLCRLQNAGVRIKTRDDAWHWSGLSGDYRRLRVLRPGYYSVDDGVEQPGHPDAAVHHAAASAVLEKGWQRAPFCMGVEGKDLYLMFYPSQAEPLPVHSGTSLRHTLRLGLSARAPAPVSWALDPEMACASGAFGPLMARTRRTRMLFPGYEQAMETGLSGARLTRLDKERNGPTSAPAELGDEAAQDEEYFGLQHYGDWPMALGAYGGKRRMYADNEYDTPYAYFLHFIRSGQPAFAQVAHQSALHMADIDCKATNGDMRFHGYHEQAEDHGRHRTRSGDLGHYWTDGLALNYLLCGDLWSWEAARAQAGYLLGVFAGAGDDVIRRQFLGCERSVGWPLVALAGVAEVNADPALIEKMAQMAAFLARFTADPDRQLEEVDQLDGEPLRWWRICQQDGTKPFMLGVVLEGLERYHRLTGDQAAATAILHISRFLVEVMWVEEVEAFIYEWNAFNRKHREVYPHYINMMVAPGLAYAYELSGDSCFKQVATRAFHAALWTLFAPGGGKEIGMVGRTSAVMVGRLHAWHQQRQTRRAAALTPSSGQAFCFVGKPADLETHNSVVLRQGAPHYKKGVLVSCGDSFAVYDLRQPASTDRGEIAFTFTPKWDCPAHPGPVAQRAYLHISDTPFTSACISIISFYTGLHVRFYDKTRHYIDVLESDIQDWKAQQPHRIRVVWDTDVGMALLWIDEQERDRCALTRRLSGAFKRLHLGHRPGNWRADGRLADLVLRLGGLDKADIRLLTG